MTSSVLMHRMIFFLCNIHVNVICILLVDLIRIALYNVYCYHQWDLWQKTFDDELYLIQLSPRCLSVLKSYSSVFIAHAFWLLFIEKFVGWWRMVLGYILYFISCVISIVRKDYLQTSDISCNKFVDTSDVVGAAPVGAAPTTSSFSTWHMLQ